MLAMEMAEVAGWVVRTRGWGGATIFIGRTAVDAQLGGGRETSQRRPFRETVGF